MGAPNYRLGIGVYIRVYVGINGNSCAVLILTYCSIRQHKYTMKPLKPHLQPYQRGEQGQKH